MKYRTIVADPPWHWPHGYGYGTNGALPYPTMTLGEICELPISDFADQSAHLYLWVTNNTLRYGFSVVGAWGFTFRTVIVWCKTLGLGGAWRNSTEFVLYGERGKTDVQRRDVGNWHQWPRTTRHSEKPEAFFDLVEQVSPGPYLELFSRRQRLGWDTWGNEALEHVALDAPFVREGTGR